MHTCPPPRKQLRKWLTEYSTVVSNYGHILFEEKASVDDDTRLALTPYFESAHLDARECFHKLARISLHPDGDEPGCDGQYPTCLPLITRKGLFGEVMCGMISEAFELVGKHEWIIPVFLFRHHEDAGQYIYTLNRDPTRTREVIGRKGDDFIGIVLDEDGAIIRFIAGEAKWRATWNPSSVKTVMLGPIVASTEGGGEKRARADNGVWFELNRALSVPLGLEQLQRILIEREPEKFASVISSLDRILAHRSPVKVERTDLVLLVGGPPASRKPGQSLIEWEAMPKEYTAGRDLQVVEILIENGEDLITGLYDSLWAKEKAHAVK